jgi:hypothetical protein
LISIVHGLVHPAAIGGRQWLDQKTIERQSRGEPHFISSK